jgi:hypothetical protein
MAFAVALSLNIAASLGASLLHQVNFLDEVLAYSILMSLLSWRAYRGSRRSSRIGSNVSIAAYLVAALTTANSWGLPIVILLAIFATQAAIFSRMPNLIDYQSQSIRQRAVGLINAIRDVLPVVLPWGLLFAGVLAVAFLGNLHVVVQPGCDSRDACTVLSRGYPLPWVYGSLGGDVYIHVYSLAKDYVQWALLCVPILYLIRLLFAK